MMEKPARKLVVALLERYERDWSRVNFVQKVTALNKRRNLIPAKLLAEEFAGIRPRRPACTVAGRC
ncbi:hypothetical protein [Massilia sp. erpn]|uniref:hypothetical protein n=1 Tax=Massilia sp. erpn TaxID=2738142 RepID=UPI00210415CE|nr:hypothetical protein [Massilia sp. erpn]UTY58829.1 hypothetical protein HPQ68_17515 [Massilia sp. erpn]